MVGVIAQDIQKILPTAVTKDSKGYLLLRQDEMFYAMINAIKQLDKSLQNLVARVCGLDKRVKTLEAQNSRQQKQLSSQQAQINNQQRQIAYLMKKVK